MDDRSIRIERAQNLWTSFVRSHEPVARGATITADPRVDFDQIGGLASAKDELLTYACAATSPDVYDHWGTFPPTGLLLIGQRGSGKCLLAKALATATDTAFVRVDAPRMVLDVIHSGGKVGDLLKAWTQTLEEVPPLTVFFDELEFSQAHEMGVRADLPIGPIMDFLLEMIDRVIATGDHLVVGSTAHPDTVRHAFAQPGRLDRVVEVTAIYPDDVVSALEIHSQQAETRAARALFDDVDWKRVVGPSHEAAIGEWVRVLHGVLRRKARLEAANEAPGLVSTGDLRAEVERFYQAQRRILTSNGGNYV